MSGKTSLERSHSKSSNALLTFLVFLAAVAFAALWAGLVLVKVLPLAGWILTIAGGALTVLSIIFIAGFTR